MRVSHLTFHRCLAVGSLRQEEEFLLQRADRPTWLAAHSDRELVLSEGVGILKVNRLNSLLPTLEKWGRYPPILGRYPK